MTDHWFDVVNADVDVDDRSDRYAPPSSILMGDAAGMVAFASVYENYTPAGSGVFVGYVWMTIDKSEKPRCGIVLTADASVAFQDSFGRDATNHLTDSDTDAEAWISDLVASTAAGAIYADSPDVGTVAGLRVMASDASGG